MTRLRDLQAAERLSDEDLAEVIARAQRRLAAEGDGTPLVQAKEIAADLDIPPEHVEAALAELRADREQAAQAAIARRKKARQRLLAFGGALGALAVLALGLGWSGAGAIADASARAEAHRAALSAALDRQATLVPALLALGGTAPGDINELARRVTEATDVSAKRAAATALQRAITQALPGQGSGAADGEQRRLSLQYELVGAQNRVTVEGRRYDEALQRWRSASGGLRGRLARALGLAAPDPPH